MKTTKTLCIKMTIDEYRYAKALSKRVGGCTRPECGSVAYGLKWALREQAKKERVSINKE
jgi:hypothetical protein